MGVVGLGLVGVFLTVGLAFVVGWRFGVVGLRVLVWFLVA